MLRLILLFLILQSGPQANAQCTRCSSMAFPIHCAISSGQCTADDIAGFIAKGHDVNAIDPERGDTPIYRLSYMYMHKREGDFETLELLMANGADPEIVSTRTHENAVDRALKWHKFELVDFYLERGYNPTIRTSHSYYKAVLDSNDKLQRKYKRYEKFDEWTSYLLFPVAVKYDFDKQRRLTLQTGIGQYTDDYMFATKSWGVIAGPAIEFANDTRFGFSVSSYYRPYILFASLGYTFFGGDSPIQTLEPRVGLSLWGNLNIGYQRKIVLYGDGAEYSRNNFFVQINLNTFSPNIKRKKREAFLEAKHY